MAWLIALVDFLMRTLSRERRMQASLEAICDGFLTTLHDADGRIRRDLDPDLLWEMERTIAHLHPVLDTLALLARLKARGLPLQEVPRPSKACRPRPGIPDPVFLVRRIRELQNRLRGLQSSTGAIGPHAEEACAATRPSCSTAAQAVSKHEGRRGGPHPARAQAIATRFALAHRPPAHAGRIRAPP